MLASFVKLISFDRKGKYFKYIKIYIKYIMNRVTYESTKQTIMFAFAGVTVYEASGL